MVLDPMSQKQLLDATRSGGGRGKKKRGLSKRRRAGGGRKLGPQDPAEVEAEGSEAAAAEAPPEAAPATEPVAAQAPAAQPAPAPAPHVYDDRRVKQLQKNARARRIAYPLAFAVGGGVLWGCMVFGLEAWIAAVAGTIAATVTHRVVDSQIR
jgi:hypothetical protein